MLVDLRPKDAELTGADAEDWLGTAGIVVNKNGIPNDPRKPMVTSGLRLGTAALTTRGFVEDDMVKVASMIDRVLASNGDASVCSEVCGEVHTLCEKYPLYGH
jgi:glycine hydroxymethyltransferase